MNGHKLGDSTLTVEDAMPVRLDVQPTGVSMGLRGNRIGSIYPFGCYSTDRGWGVLAQEKMETSTIFLQERKLNLMMIINLKEEQGGIWDEWPAIEHK